MDQQKRLVFRATKDEMIFEAATQLGLLMQIFMSSGIGSSASSLSAVSSIVVIGKVGWVQNFLDRSIKTENISLMGQLEKYLTFDCFICTAHSENKD